jgi:hypothetical protein
MLSGRRYGVRLDVVVDVEEVVVTVGGVWYCDPCL